MNYAILVLVILALFHFIYESILAPSFRMKLRFDLEALRRRLFRLQTVNADSRNEGHFQYLDDSSSALLEMLHRFDAGTLVAVTQEMRRNTALRRQVDLRVQELDACASPEVRAVWRDIRSVATRALLVNHGGWFIYVLPLAPSCFVLRHLGQVIKASASVPKPELFRILRCSAPV